MLLHLDDEQGLGFGYRRGENDRIEMQTRGSGGILWKDSHINLKGTKELELVLKARKAINLRHCSFKISENSHLYHFANQMSSC